MDSHQRFRDLHDRATRGLPLADAEQTELAAWYAAQDAAEAILLGTAVDDPAPTDLQARIDTVLAELLAASRQVQTLSAQNTTLRAELAELHQRLRRQPTTNAA